jgi:hypothetical protein
LDERQSKIRLRDVAPERGRLFLEVDKPVLRNTLSFMDSQIEEYIYQQSNYPVTNTGSQFLDPVWRWNAIKNNHRPAKICMLISLN